MQRSERIVSGEDYIKSITGRTLNIYLFGERVSEPVEHPIMKPSINAVVETYELGVRAPELATVVHY